MSPDQLGRIFQAFEQVGKTTKQAEGTGLGLNISRQLVNLMGGEIQVSSELGQGSLFWFEISVPTIEALPNSVVSSTGSIQGYEGQRRKILVVDDHRENRLMLLNLLQPLGFEITLAEDGQEGVKQAEATQPDMILMDLVMPVMTGFEAVQKIRQTPALKDIPIIAVSASVLETDKEKSQVVGCQAFLSKPIEFDKLFGLLETYMALNWRYATSKTTKSTSEMLEIQSSTDIVPPPKAELELLYEQAMFGDMKLIIAIAEELEIQDVRYKPFANKLQQYAQRFQDEAIIEFIEQFLKY